MTEPMIPVVSRLTSDYHQQTATSVWRTGLAGELMAAAAAPGGSSDDVTLIVVRMAKPGCA
jgi:hypothetical protein